MNLKRRARKYIVDASGEGLETFFVLSAQLSSHIAKGALVDFIAGHSPANPATKQNNGLYEFVDNKHWRIAKLLGARSVADYVEEMKNALLMETLESDWSIVLYKSQLYAVHNSDIRVVQLP